MSGEFFLGFSALLCLGVFLNGLRFSRMTSNPWAGKRLFGMPVGGGELPLERVRAMGRLQMIVAPLFLIFVTALCFGLLGPVEGVTPIQFVTE